MITLGCSQSTESKCTLDDLVARHRFYFNMEPIIGRVLIKAGGGAGWALGFNGYVDKLTIKIKTSEETSFVFKQNEVPKNTATKFRVGITAVIAFITTLFTLV